MPKRKRTLWECPKCGRQFANRNQWHGCTTLTLADCFKGKSEKVIDLFSAFEAAVHACGPVRVHPTKARIAFITRMTFAGAKLKKDHIEAGILLPYRSPSPRFHKFFPYGQGGGHSLRLDAVDDIDDEVRQWLAEAYALGRQDAPKAITSTSTARKRRLPSAKRCRASKRTGKVFYLHWNEEELEERVAPLRAAGHDVRVHWSTDTTPKWGDYVPDVFVISLDRLPSHGRSYAGWIWEAKKRQGIPIVFAGGQANKVKVTKAQFPNAYFCATNDVPKVVSRVLAG